MKYHRLWVKWIDIGNVIIWRIFSVSMFHFISVFVFRSHTVHAHLQYNSSWNDFDQFIGEILWITRGRFNCYFNSHIVVTSWHWCQDRGNGAGMTGVSVSWKQHLDEAPECQWLRQRCAILPTTAVNVTTDESYWLMLFHFDGWYLQKLLLVWCAAEKFWLNAGVYDFIERGNFQLNYHLQWFIDDRRISGIDHREFFRKWDKYYVRMISAVSLYERQVCVIVSCLINHD